MKLITIERECGSGGTQIARELARRCGIPCYGSEILDKVAEILGMPVERIRSNEENVTNSLLYSLYILAQSQSGNYNVITDEGRIFVEEQRIIREYAKQGSAVFLGHCASEALKDFSGVVKVFIHADKESKAERIRREYGISSSEADSFEKKNNRRRAAYYYANTQEKWDNLRNYDIVLDSTKLGTDGCADILEGLLKDSGENGK